MTFIRKNWGSLLTAVVLTVTGILLLVDPAAWSVAIIRIVGILFVVLGVLDLVKYFRTAPVIAAKGSAFSSGVTMITAGLFLFFGSGWFISAFPLLAMLYGLVQVLLGIRKLQKMTDALRMKHPLWYLYAVSAALTLLFGFIVVLNPDMKFISIWLFTGVTLIVEGVFDAAALIVGYLRADKADKKEKPQKD